jgi:hypothetical protein
MGQHGFIAFSLLEVECRVSETILKRKLNFIWLKIPET